MGAAEVRVLSMLTVRPSPRGKEGRHERIPLTAWDLKMLSMDYIQKGILFYKPLDHDHEGIISGLLSSFSRALDHFFPLAGRLTTVEHNTTPPSLSIYLDCTDDGAAFVNATAVNVTVSDIVTPLYVPRIVHSFFPLNRVIGHDGHSEPLLAVQVTELADGVFIGCSLNHAIADGTSFWHFINSWSEIARTGAHQISHSPVLDRWFLDSCPPPIRLPFSGHQDFIKRPVFPPVKECFFHFSAKSIAELKAKANDEIGTNKISSLQALLALVWRSVTRARGLDPKQQTTYSVVVGGRPRLNPPLPTSYLGNSWMNVPAKAPAGELVERGLGWSAWLLNQTVASQSEAAVRGELGLWTMNPTFTRVDQFKPCDLVTGSSPRFNVFGNDFGWGRPVAVRSGCGSKMDGKVTVFPGPEEGSMGLEVCLSARTLSSLVQDEEFMEAVTST